jgi:FAD/FMN-containing dehydrogenase
MEVTYRAHPKVTLQVAYIVFAAASIDAYNGFFNVITQNADKWAEQGWGGYLVFGAKTRTLCALALFNPNLDLATAKTSMTAPLTYAASNASAQTFNASVTTSDSFMDAFKTFIEPNEPLAGASMAIGSRLIPKSLLSTSLGQAAVASALANISNIIMQDPLAPTYGAPLQILVTPPSSYKALTQYGESFSDSSVTPAWRSAVWHVALGNFFSNEASVAEIQTAFKNAHNAAQILRNITPDSGAYQNEADVFEPDPVGAFWGEKNYEKLKDVKKAVDPQNIATCWACIGWEKSNARYACYPDIGVNVPEF